MFVQGFVPPFCSSLLLSRLLFHPRTTHSHTPHTFARFLVVDSLLRNTRLPNALRKPGLLCFLSLNPVGLNDIFSFAVHITQYTRFHHQSTDCAPPSPHLCCCPNYFPPLSPFVTFICVAVSLLRTYIRRSLSKSVLTCNVRCVLPPHPPSHPPVLSRPG